MIRYSRRLMILIFCSCFIRSGSLVFAQMTNTIHPDLVNKVWSARWITSPDITGREYGVYLFRKTFVVDSSATRFIVHVSADNRYKLFVNERYVCNGPARGDLLKWYFESVDIAPYLKKGKNCITAVVWNFSDLRPLAQVSGITGFILQGNGETERVINTDSSWRVTRDLSYAPLPVNLNQYYVTGPGERFDCARHPWNWMQSEYDDARWSRVKKLEHGTPVLSFREWGGVSEHVLYTREIPLMEEHTQRFSSIRRADLAGITDQFLEGGRSVTIPAHTTATILFDQSHLTNAYPVLKFSGGKNSELSLTYAESLVDEKGEKGNRNDIDRKHIIGNKDIIIADGGDYRTFSTLWWRTFRYVEMTVETHDEPLSLQEFSSVFTGYPFVERATFACDDSLLSRIWNVGWRTQRLCAGETYFDCPYYEQLQYVGDTRIQALVSSYVSGDTRLMRSAIASIHDSRLPFGITQSRYPSAQTQIIPPFSLLWTAMVHDYWMIDDDANFVRSNIPCIMDVLNWYESKIDSTGMCGRMEWWNFIDWVRDEKWEQGTPPGLHTSHSSIITLQYAYALQKAADLLRTFGFKEESSRYARLAASISTAVYRNCYDVQRGLIADTPEKESFSQHANVLAILTSAIPKAAQARVMEQVVKGKGMAQSSLYFRYYLTEALAKSGLADRYADMLDPWTQMLERGLTTFAEEPDPTRSDCHAWSASPVYYFLSLVCGVQPAAPGFKSVRIEPHPGRLKWINGSMPHRLGMIRVALKKEKGNHLSGEVILPEHLTGTFVWNGHTITLRGGTTRISI
ncbi:MAG TPA: alpha-L-rhamnosidase C-terminal domain-containing protein [Bacteroidota bacterium]|nr:alpha-L-rhamnosidase C-terminal domain-containing protein [Bacteroidota bacterium]